MCSSVIDTGHKALCPVSLSCLSGARACANGQPCTQPRDWSDDEVDVNTAFSAANHAILAPCTWVKTLDWRPGHFVQCHKKQAFLAVCACVPYIGTYIT